METYKNVLANKFMRDTNYIIIKDTDDLEELERQYELFNSQLTVRQQRLSDDRSIEIWNMTNKEHYEALKIELMKNIDSQYNDNEDDNDVYSYDPEDEEVKEDDVTNLINDDFDIDFEIPDDENDITTPVKEDSSIVEDEIASTTPVDEVPSKNIPIENNEQDIAIDFACTRDKDKDTMADQYEIDTNMHIIGTVKGDTTEEFLQNLEKTFTDFNAQTHDHRRKSDDKCREIYGMSNLERYNKLKACALSNMKVAHSQKIKSTDNTFDIDTHAKLEFVSQVYDNMQAVNEAEQIKVNKHRRFNDTPYFTPTELIDMGVHGNHNFYSKDADNDGLIKSKIKAVTWFGNYQDMCMDHIFEDYTKDWIDTLDILYSDYEDIKASGNEDKILARKQSILDLGWNPEIPFNRKNRLKASKRVSKILDETIPKDIFINLDDIIDDNDIVEEQATKSTHKPVLLIFTQGKTPVISQGIKFFTGSEYSHASISFDPTLNEVYSYNMRGENFGFVRENLSSFKDNVISVMAFFAPNHIVESLKNKVEDFKNNKTTFDLRIFFNKIIHIDHKVSKNEYNQVCSTFVDTVLKSGGINLVGDIKIPDPGQLYMSAKSIPNKIIEVFNDIAPNYNGSKVKKKLDTLLSKGHISINESIYDIDAHESNDFSHNIDLWEYEESNLLWVTGLSGSGKSTISKEIADKYDAVYVELDNLQMAKMKSWNTTKNEMLDSYIESVGGLDNIFPYCNDLDEITWKAIVKEEDECQKEFTRFFDYAINYAKKHKNQRFVIEGVQIAYYYSNESIKKISKYPVIIKMNGPLKTEFRRERRSIERGIEKGDNFIKIFKHISKHICNWVKGKFYLDNYKDLKDFKNYIGESVRYITEEQGPRREVTMTKKLIDFYKDSTKDWEVGLANLNWNNNCRGIMLLSDDWGPIKDEERELLGYVAVEDNKVIGLEVSPHYYQRGTRSYLLYLAKNDLGAEVQEPVEESVILETASLPSGYTLRNATKNDIPIMYEWGMKSIDKRIREDPKVIKYMKDDAKKSVPLTKMIMYKNETVGMLTTDDLSPGSDYWYIGEIYLVKEHRGKGIGTTLLKNEIEKHDKLKLQVAQSNKGALKLYKSLGFEITETNDKGKMYVMTLDKTKNKVNESVMNEGILDRIKNTGKYKAPLPSIAYKNGKPLLSATLRKYENITLPIEIYEKYGNNAFLTQDDIYSEIFSPNNLREIQSIPKNKHIYQVIYCNNRYNVILVYEDLDRVEKYLKTRNKSIDDYNRKPDKSTNISISRKYCYIDKENNENLNGSEFINPKTGVYESVINESLFNKNKYDAPKPSIGYDEKGRQYLLRRYENITLPVEMFGKLEEENKSSDEIDSIIFSPNNLRPYTKSSLPKHYVLYQVAYCNDKNHTIIVVEDLDRVKKFLSTVGETLDDYIEDKAVRRFNISSKYCTIKNTKINESVSILNEVKQFPVEFDKEGNLIIYKSRIGSLSFGDEIADSVQLLEVYRNANNVEGIKYELAKLWYINDCIEKKLKKRLTNDQYKELIDTRATCLNVFKLNLDYVMKAEKGFNFSDYYNSTPFSDNSTKVNVNTIKYVTKALLV